MRRCGPALALLLAGCATAGSWTKAGADSAASARDYSDCRALGETAVKTEADIDQDILASRADDRQRAGVLRTATRTMTEQTGDRAAAITQSCMRAKGYAAPR